VPVAKRSNDHLDHLCAGSSNLARWDAFATSNAGLRA
jgi:hypothetical protein